MTGPDIAELLRLIEQVVRLGTIYQVDHGNARCRVRSGALTSTWVPWVVQRAGQLVTWSPPTVGEQAVLLSPGGDTAAAVALVGLYSAGNAPPTHDSHHHHAQFVDGAWLRYDHAAHELTAHLPAGSTARITATDVEVYATDVRINAETTTIVSDVNITGQVTLQGAMTSTGDIVAGGISAQHHTHGGVESGSASTDEPQ